MRKVVLLLACVLFLSCVPAVPAGAAAADYSRVRAGGLVFPRTFASSGDTVYLCARSCVTSKAGPGFFLFRIPVSAIGPGDCLVVDSRELGGFSAAYFWCRHDLAGSTYWSSAANGATGVSIKNTAVGGSDFRLLEGSVSSSVWDNALSYHESGVHVFEVPEGLDGGYLYISGLTTDSRQIPDPAARDPVSAGAVFWDSSPMRVSVMQQDDIPGATPTPTPTPIPTPTPTPIPTPTPTPVIIPDIGGSSAELGTFGTDDGTQNSVFTAFEKLYDSLHDIVTDESTPDMSVLGDGSPKAKGTRARACPPFRSAPAAASLSVQDGRSGGVSGADEKVLLDKWRAEQYETVDIGASWNISPVSVETAETSAVLGEGYRDGNAYVLHYQLHLPFRFIYSGHAGTAYSNPSVLFSLRVDYAGFPDYGRGTVQYGTPYIHVDNDGVSYDRYDALEASGPVISGDAGIAFLNIPVLDNLSRDSYDVVIDFPLYITDVNDPLVFANSFAYESTVTLESLTYVQDAYFLHVSDATTDQTLQDIADEQKKQDALENERYEEEQEKTQEAIDSVSSGVDEITGTLSSWEIFVLPLTVMKDFVKALASSSDARLTFPSFSLMGQTLWPSYTFDLAMVSEKFPFLCDCLHLVSGILVVVWFLRYLWRKWALVTGDDLPEEG